MSSSRISASPRKGIDEDEFMRVISEMNKICGEDEPGGPPPLRSRHCSENSGMSNDGSFDSAIGDVYSVQTPRSSNDLEQEMYDRRRSPKKMDLGNDLGEVSIRVLGGEIPHRKSSPLVGCKMITPSPVAPPRYNEHHIVRQPNQVRLEMHEKQEVERVCFDLLRQFHYASSLHPRHNARAWVTRSGDDPLLITTRLLADSLTRMRIFLYNLDPMKWLSWEDRNRLYNAHICSMAILKASVSVDLNAAPPAYPLPYGEYLGEVEALHLILAHDLYNELRQLLEQIQATGVKEVPVMLLVMMIAFFQPGEGTRQPEKVESVQDYYKRTLHSYLRLRYGLPACSSIMNNVLSAIVKVGAFSDRFKEFLSDVTRCGLQKQYESVCENIGLMAFLLQTEPALER